MESNFGKGKVMKIKRFELVRVIDKLKSIVQKNDVHPALSGILVKDGYFIASNTEITMQVKLEAAEGESFIIPMRAFDLIKNLPEGEVRIAEAAKNTVLIQMDKIQNKYKSFSAEDFVYAKEVLSNNTEGISFAGKELMEGLEHILFAAADGGVANKLMTGINFQVKDGLLKLTALDGHVIACDTIDVEGETELNITVPKAAIKKLVGMGMIDDVELHVDSRCAVFRTDEYAIYTRLLDGEYFRYGRMFQDAPPLQTVVDRKEIIGAMNRAKSCTDDQRPIKLEFNQSEMKISIMDNIADYEEIVPLQKNLKENLSIGFNSKLVLDAIKSFNCENVRMSFTSPVTPMLIEDEDSNMKAMVLPVKIQ